MTKTALPTIHIKGTARGQLHLFAAVLSMAALLGWELIHSSGWNGPYLWAWVGTLALGAAVFGLRMAVPPTLSLDPDGVTWKVFGWPSRRLQWAEVENFGVVPPRPPLIDPLIGYNVRNSAGPRLGLGSGWTGYDATISGGWRLAPEKLVETLEEYRRASRK